MSPEQQLVAEKYLIHKTPIDTAKALAIPADKVIDILRMPSVRKYIDANYLENGFTNKLKLQGTLDKIIESKLEEATESGIYSRKDLAELLDLSHKMRMAEERLQMDRLKLELQLQQAQQVIEQRERLSGQKIEAVDKRFQLRLEHEKRLKEKETNAYTSLLERLLTQVPMAERVIDEAIDGDFEDVQE